MLRTATPLQWHDSSLFCICLQGYCFGPAAQCLWKPATPSYSQ